MSFAPTVPAIWRLLSNVENLIFNWDHTVKIYYNNLDFKSLTELKIPEYLLSFMSMVCLETLLLTH